MARGAQSLCLQLEWQEDFSCVTCTKYRVRIMYIDYEFNSKLAISTDGKEKDISVQQNTNRAKYLRFFLIVYTFKSQQCWEESFAQKVEHVFFFLKRSFFLNVKIFSYIIKEV